MAINIVVAATDLNWHAFLSQQRDLSEVNFWSPSATVFRSLSEGELFLFKAKAPVNKIVGGGIFAHSTIMPCSYAWEAFGTSNGASSFAEMRSRIVSLKQEPTHRPEDFEIGCRIITQPFFFDQSQWFDPPGWNRSIVRHKTYLSDSAEGVNLWNAVQDRLRNPGPVQVAEDAPVFGSPQLVAPRLGQGAFRVKVTDSYSRKCAVTGERTLPALGAAHIRPHSEGGLHDASNGLLCVATSIASSMPAI